MDKADLSIFSSLDARKYHSWSFELDPCLNKRRRSGGQVLRDARMEYPGSLIIRCLITSSRGNLSGNLGAILQDIIFTHLTIAETILDNSFPLA